MPNRYDRITGQELRDSIRDLQLTFGQFARLAGTQRHRVLGWLNGKQEIPHHVNVMIELLSLPGAMERALAVTDDWICEESSDEEEEPAKTKGTATPDTS